MDETNLKIIIPKDSVNKALENGLFESEKMSMNIGSEFGYDFFKKMKNIFVPISSDITIIGLFLLIFQNEEKLYKEIEGTSEYPMNIRLVTHPIINALLDINPKVIRVLWDQLHDESDKFIYTQLKII